ncbi:hypothetical protein NDU88_001281 [Pleurodeles waltl]|uniref:Uncharacterized protein n=1 Tax=Pleurodeles waltl TaxID=8319 RepID=A0AAV7P898_PLEWA|nr:hypothetical protein NDU88_001281 [Pleurodeles waltl]
MTSGAVSYGPENRGDACALRRLETVIPRRIVGQRCGALRRGPSPGGREMEAARVCAKASVDCSPQMHYRTVMWRPALGKGTRPQALNSAGK